MTADGTAQWIDPDEIRDLVDRVRDGYESAPSWVPAILLAMIGVEVLVVICRIARNLLGRLIGVILVAVIAARLRFYGPHLLGYVPAWLP